MRNLCNQCKTEYTDGEIHNPITGEVEPMCDHCRQAFEARVGIKMADGIAERTATIQTWYEGCK